MQFLQCRAGYSALENAWRAPIDWSQDGTDISRSGQAGTWSDYGDIIKWDSGEEAEFINSFQSRATDSKTVDAGPATIYRTGLPVLQDGSNAYVNVEFEDIVITLHLDGRRTMEWQALFPTFTSNRTYREIGFYNPSWTGFEEKSLSSRIVYPDGIPVNAGQQLEVNVILTITCSPVLQPASIGLPVTLENPIQGIYSIGHAHSAPSPGYGVGFCGHFARDPIPKKIQLGSRTTPPGVVLEGNFPSSTLYTLEVVDPDPRDRETDFQRWLTYTGLADPQSTEEINLVLVQPGEFYLYWDNRITVPVGHKLRVTYTNELFIDLPPLD